MTIRNFLELIEFKAKAASVFPFCIGILYSIFNYHTMDVLNSIIFFIAMFLFNTTVDALDNYNDYFRAHSEHDYKQKTNIIGREHLSTKWILTYIILSSGIATLLGIYLVFRVGLTLLLLGIICFAVGVAYSTGPRPISASPLGELFAGFTMGFMITLICTYINVVSAFSWTAFSILSVFLISLPSTLWIANVMLANNICDYEEDTIEKRFTLVHYLGVKGALRLFKLNNVLAYVAMVLAIFFHLAPILLILGLLSIPLVYRQLQLFSHKQVKRETFVCSVRILGIGSLFQIISFILGVIIV